MRDIKTRREVLKTARVIGRKRRIFKGSLVTIVCVVLIVLGLFLCNASFLRITKVVISGNAISRGDTLVKLAEGKIAGRYAFIIPRDNILFYPQAQITRDIHHLDPALASTKVSLNSDRQLILEVSERKPEFLWCNKLNQSDKHCYFMDKDGVAFMEAPQFSDNIFMEIVGRTKDDPLGKLPLEKKEFLTLYKFVKILPVLMKGSGLADFSIYRAESLGSGDYKILFRQADKIGGKNWYLIVNLKQEATNALAAFSTVIDSEVFKRDVVGSEQGLQYIDLRFGKKIFYKFK